MAIKRIVVKQKVKRVRIKKNNEKELELIKYHEIKNKLIDYFDARKGEYSSWLGGDICDINVLKKLKKTVKITHDRNIFMIFEKCQEEQFIVPIFISIMAEKESENKDILKEFGCHFITINSVNEIEWKLEEIK